jgi:cell division control protein 7
MAEASTSPSLPCASDFTIIEPIGYGSFSNVFSAVHNASDRRVALKRLFWNNSPERIVREIKWLRGLDHPNIVRLLTVFREADQATVVLDYVPHVPFRTLLGQFNGILIKQYMSGLLSALEYMHSHKIIHRDVKPANFLFDPATGIGRLIDFGLCEDDLHIQSQRAPIEMVSNDDDRDLLNPEKCQHRPKMIANRAGTRGFRAPEVLFSTWNQSRAIDIWSAGVVLLSILTQRYPFFKSPDDLTSLVEISIVVGTDRLKEAARECGRRVRFPAESSGMDLESLVGQVNRFVGDLEVPDTVFDLLTRMLEPVPSRRISAADALNHPFFTEDFLA